MVYLSGKASLKVASRMGKDTIGIGLSSFKVFTRGRHLSQAYREAKFIVLNHPKRKPIRTSKSIPDCPFSSILLGGNVTKCIRHYVTNFVHKKYGLQYRYTNSI